MSIATTAKFGRSLPPHPGPLPRGEGEPFASSLATFTRFGLNAFFSRTNKTRPQHGVLSNFRRVSLAVRSPLGVRGEGEGRSFTTKQSPYLTEVIQNVYEKIHRPSYPQRCS